MALPSGRYAHNAAWVTRHATEAAGLRVVRRTPLPSLRVDAGTPVPGTLLVLQRAARTDGSHVSGPPRDEL